MKLHRNHIPVLFWIFVLSSEANASENPHPDVSSVQTHSYLVSETKSGTNVFSLLLNTVLKVRTNESIKIYDRENLIRLRKNEAYKAYLVEVDEEWIKFEEQLQRLSSYYHPLPIGLKLSSDWYQSLRVPSSAFSTSTDSFTKNHLMRHGVGFGDHTVLENGNTLIFYANWDDRVASAGNLYAVEYANGEIIDIASQEIDGAIRSHVLRNQDGSTTVVSPGVDEGDKDCYDADSHVYDFENKSWDALGIVIGAHGSSVFDYEQDGDDDVIATNFQRCAGQGTQDQRPVILKNLGNDRFEAVRLNDSDIPNFLSINAFYQSGETLVVAFGDASGVGLRLGIATGERNVLAYWDESEISDKNPFYAEELPLPYFERDIYRRFDYPDLQDSSWEGTIGLSHDVQIQRKDLNYDGLEDLVVGSMVWSNDYPSGVIQILINHGDAYVDETDERLHGFLMAGNNTHQIEIMDVNGDGFDDILLSDHGNGFQQMSDAVSEITPSEYQNIGQRTVILTNDGSGHFVTQIHSQLSDNCPASDIPALNQDGTFTFMCIHASYSDAGSRTAEITTTNMAYPLSTGPFGLNPSDFGVPNFNEFFYLRNYPSASEAVRLGRYGSGLEHYLAEGGLKGYRIHARD